jgi:EAL domain-containing protein (putative c-di-GMP-specific phosphodiesterase class I)
VDAVVRLAHGLGMTVVAEGVQTEEQADRISAIGCDKCQGYYFARPTPADSIHTLIGQSRDPVGAGR